MLLPLAAETITFSDGYSFQAEILSSDDEYLTIKIPKDSLREETGTAWPEKKQTARPGNFEIIQGGSVLSPFDTAKLRAAAAKALSRHNYVFTNEEPGALTVTLRSRGRKLVLRFCYTPEEYWYEYVDSEGMDAKPEKDKIDNDYFRWIKILERDISKYYYE